MGKYCVDLDFLCSQFFFIRYQLHLNEIVFSSPFFFSIFSFRIWNEDTYYIIAMKWNKKSAPTFSTKINCLLFLTYKIYVQSEWTSTVVMRTEYCKSWNIQELNMLPFQIFSKFNIDKKVIFFLWYDIFKWPLLINWIQLPCTELIL